MERLYHTAVSLTMLYSSIMIRPNTRPHLRVSPPKGHGSRLVPDDIHKVHAFRIMQNVQEKFVSGILYMCLYLPLIPLPLATSDNYTPCPPLST